VSKNKYGFDQFYTKKEVVISCLKDIDFTLYDVVIEPSAGDGAFFDEIPHKNKIGYDIDPKKNNIIKCDFLTIDHDIFSGKNVLSIGNPPFGRNSSMALKFIKKSALFATTIAFILPKGFKKRSTIGKVFLNINVSESSHYFLKVDNPEEIYKKIKNLKYSSNDTTGPRSIPKNELIRMIESVI
jgi:hypothetical protein